MSTLISSAYKYGHALGLAELDQAEMTVEFETWIRANVPLSASEAEYGEAKQGSYVRRSRISEDYVAEFAAEIAFRAARDFQADYLEVMAKARALSGPRAAATVIRDLAGFY